MSLTRIVDYILNPDTTPRSGTVTFIATRLASNGTGLVPASSSVSCVLTSLGKFDVKLTPTSEFDAETYYQLWLKAGDVREFLGLYQVPVSSVVQTLLPNKITSTSLVSRYRFASESVVQVLSETAASAAISTVVNNPTDTALPRWDGGVSKFADSNLRHVSGGAKTIGTHEITGNLVYNATSPGTGKVLAATGWVDATSIPGISTNTGNDPAAVKTDTTATQAILGKLKGTFLDKGGAEYHVDSYIPVAVGVLEGIQLAINTAIDAGGGVVRFSGIEYDCGSGYLELTKLVSSVRRGRIVLRGAGINATVLKTSTTAKAFLQSNWDVNGSWSAFVYVEDMTLKQTNNASFAAGFGEVCGTGVGVRRVRFENFHYGVVFDQTNDGRVEDCKFETWSANAWGGHTGEIDPTTIGWTKVGTPDTATDGRWKIGTASSNAEGYYWQAISTSAFAKGFTWLGKLPEITNDDGGTLQKVRIDDGTKKYELERTATGIKLNGGSNRTASLASIIRLNIAVGGATADLWIDGTRVDTAVAALSTSGSARISFGDFETTADSVAWWPDFAYYGSNPLPACVWLVNGDEFTTGSTAGFTNVITITKNMFNAAAIQVAIDGSVSCHVQHNLFNGGLHHVWATDTVGLDLGPNYHEDSVLTNVRLAPHKIGGSNPSAATNTAVRIKGGIQSATDVGAPYIDIISANSVTLDGIYFAKITGYCVRVETSGGVADVCEIGCRSLGADIFGSLAGNHFTGSFPYIFSTSPYNSTDREAALYRLRTKRLRVYADALASLGAQIELYDDDGSNKVTIKPPSTVSTNYDFVPIRHNYAATADPTANEDSGDGYAIGSVWIRTNTSPRKIFTCVDATATAAVWLQTTTV